jgi:hypothetical protein
VSRGCGRLGLCRARSAHNSYRASYTTSWDATRIELHDVSTELWSRLLRALVTMLRRLSANDLAHRVARDLQLPRDRLDFLALNEMCPPNSSDRIHRQHPRLAPACESLCGDFEPQGVGSGTIWGVSKLGGRNITKYLRPRKLPCEKSLFAGQMRKPTHDFLGKADDTVEETGESSRVRINRQGVGGESPLR